MNEVVLVVAAHPDDEILGCGGTLAKHVSTGDLVEVCILAEGITSRDAQRDRATASAELSTLAECAKRANAKIGCRSIHLHDFPDNRMDSVDLIEVVKVIESHISQLKPSIIYTHHDGDVNVDHKIVHDAVVAACRPQPNHPVRTLLFFEVASSTEWRPAHSARAFIPNWFVDITSELPVKVAALAEYVGEMREWPHPRSLKNIEHLSLWRGSTVGVGAAEAFELGRTLR